MPPETPRTLDGLFTHERRDDARASGNRTNGRRADRPPALVDTTGLTADDVRGRSDDEPGRTFDTDRLITMAWKSGNFLRHTGIRHGTTVGVVGGGPMALFAFFGTALLGGRVQFDPPTDCPTDERFRTVVAPADVIERYTVAPGAQRVCYGGEPPEPAVHHFESGLWSENPSFPPVEIDPETPLLWYSSSTTAPGPSTRTTEAETDDPIEIPEPAETPEPSETPKPSETPEPITTISHGEAMSRARSYATQAGIEPGTRVLVRDSFADPRVLVAGVLAPLVVGGTVVLRGVSEDGLSSALDVDHVVGFDDGPDPVISAWFGGSFET